MFEITGMKIRSIEGRLNRKAVLNEILKGGPVLSEIEDVAERAGRRMKARNPQVEILKTYTFSGRTRNIVTVEGKKDKEKRENQRTPQKAKDKNSRRTRRRGT